MPMDSNGNILFQNHHNITMLKTTKHALTIIIYNYYSFKLHYKIIVIIICGIFVDND